MRTLHLLVQTFSQAHHASGTEQINGLKPSLTEFLEAGKKRLAGDTARQATSTEVKDLRAESLALKEVVADLTLENRILKKNTAGAGGNHE